MNKKLCNFSFHSKMIRYLVSFSSYKCFALLLETLIITNFDIICCGLRSDIMCTYYLVMNGQ